LRELTPQVPAVTTAHAAPDEEGSDAVTRLVIAVTDTGDV